MYLSRKINVFCSFAIVLAFQNTVLFSQSKTAPVKEFTEWKPVPRAAGYQIEIRDSKNRIVFEKTVRTNRVEFELPDGIYEERIGVLNKFDKIIGWSKWTEFIIDISRVPEIEINKKIPVLSGKKEFELHFEGKNIFQEIKIFVESGTEKIPVKKINVSNSNSVSVTLDLSSVKPGQYDVVFENPRKKILRKNKLLIVGSESEISETISRSGDEVVAGPDQASAETKTVPAGKSFFGSLWRASLVPGLGLHYAGEKNLGYATGVLFTDALYNVYIKHQRMSHENDIYNERRIANFSELFLPKNSIPGYPLNAGLAHDVRDSHIKEKAGHQYSESLRILGAVYVSQLAGTIFVSRNFDKRMWNVLWKSALLPGLGHIEAKEKKTGIAYMGLFGASLINLINKQETLHTERTVLIEKRTSLYTTLAYPVGFGFNLSLAQIAFFDRKINSDYSHAKSNYDTALKIAGAIYAIQLLHAFYSGNKYENAGGLAGNSTGIHFIGMGIVAIPAVKKDPGNFTSQSETVVSLNFLF
ncbi:MAG: hypothetical protein K8R21_06130 [Leptospira sp.]|nr:hypothetical protein [Leptospira sp.]